MDPPSLSSVADGEGERLGDGAPPGCGDVVALDRDSELVDDECPPHAVSTHALAMSAAKAVVRRFMPGKPPTRVRIGGWFIFLSIGVS